MPRTPQYNTAEFRAEYRYSMRTATWGAWLQFQAICVLMLTKEWIERYLLFRIGRYEVAGKYAKLPELYFGLARLYQSSWGYHSTEAAELLQATIDGAQAQNDLGLAVDACVALSHFYWIKQPDVARELCERALQCAKELGEQGPLWKAYDALRSRATSDGDQAASLEFLEHGDKVRKEESDNRASNFKVYFAIVASMVVIPVFCVVDWFVSVMAFISIVLLLAILESSRWLYGVVSRRVHRSNSDQS